MYKGIELTLRANGEGPSATTNNSTDTSLLQESASVDNGNPTTIEIEKCLFYILYEADRSYQDSEYFSARATRNLDELESNGDEQWQPVDDEGWSEFYKIFIIKQYEVDGRDNYPENYVKYLAQQRYPEFDISTDKFQTKLSTPYTGGIDQPLNLIDEAALRFKELNDKNDTPVLYFNFKGFDLNNSEDFRNCLKAQLVIAAKCDKVYGSNKTSKVKIHFQVGEKNIFQSLSNSHTPEEAVELAKKLAENPRSFDYEREGYGSYQELFENDEIEGELKDIFEGQGLEEPVGLTNQSGMGNGMIL